jgi:hypothetical protein
MAQSQAEAQEQTVNASPVRDDPPAAAAPAVGPAASAVSPQACATCEAAAAGNGATATSPSWVYALGNIEARFPSISVEKEFAQATGRDYTSGLTDRQALHAVLSKHENRYLARQCCYVMTIQGLETYILTPRDPADLALLVGAVRPNPSPMDLDVVIGIKGSIAPPQMCNGLMVPIVVVDQIYSFDRDALIKASQTGEDYRQGLRARGRGSVRPRHADRRQRWSHRRTSRLKLSRGPLPGHLQQGRRVLRAE